MRYCEKWKAVNLPVAYHEKLKLHSVKSHKSMTKLVEEMIDALPTWPVVKQETPAGDAHEIP